MKEFVKTVQLGRDTYTFKSGKIARQANGAVLLQVGETVVFASACAANKADPLIDFFPLRVDYQEKFSAAGKTLGGFIKREGRPSQREVLTSRLIDRPFRPMFQEGYFNEVQLISYVLSYDGICNPDVHAITATSAALHISDIPLLKPIAGVRVGLIDGKFVINPTMQEQLKSDLELIMAGTEDAILMIEGHCNFLTEQQVLDSLEFGHKSIKILCHAIEEWSNEVGKKVKNVGTLRLPNKALEFAIGNQFGKELKTALATPEKAQRILALNHIDEAAKAYFFPSEENQPVACTEFEFKTAMKSVHAHIMRKAIFEDKRRCDGRKTDVVRKINAEVGLLPRPHGTALFTRGETQALAVCTLGGPDMRQKFETLDEEGASRFYLQYTFPPFSVGEVGRMGAPGRREVGHGRLAEKALAWALPTEEAFGYSIRLESNITESNGSSSMASICGGSLAMMNAGVPLKSAISGIAMGLLLEKDGSFEILSDILGDEDALGDMDFKIAGDRHGVTAFQLDIKVEGITHEIMEKALHQARIGRLHILDEMDKVLSKPAKELSKHAPKLESFKIPQSKIGLVIGPKGKMIQEIMAATGVEINIDDSGDHGLVTLTSTSSEGMTKAKEWIQGLVQEAEVGKTYMGKVTSIMPFGAFVEIMPGKEGLLHISKIAYQRLETMDESGIKAGDQIEVMVDEVDEKTQKIGLNRKKLLPKPEGYVEEPRRERSERRPEGRDDRRGGDRRDDRRRDDRPRSDRPRDDRPREDRPRSDRPREDRPARTVELTAPPPLFRSDSEE